MSEAYTTSNNSLCAAGGQHAFAVFTKCVMPKTEQHMLTHSTKDSIALEERLASYHLSSVIVAWLEV